MPDDESAGDNTTPVRVKPDTWKRLNGLKEPGDSFDDVIRHLLNETQGAEEGNGQTTATAD